MAAPLVPIVGGIAKVGGSVAVAKGINATLQVLAKLKLGRGKTKDLIIDKLIDYAIAELTGGNGDTQPEPLKVLLKYSGYSSIAIPLLPGDRLVTLSVINHPAGFGRRFADADGDDEPNGNFGISKLTIDKFNFGGVSFNAALPMDTSGTGGQTNGGFLIGSTSETPWTFMRQSFEIPFVATARRATFLDIYVLPFVEYEVFITSLKV